MLDLRSFLMGNFGYPAMFIKDSQLFLMNTRIDHIPPTPPPPSIRYTHPLHTVIDVMYIITLLLLLVNSIYMQALKFRSV